jgi:hypothetical protein
VVLSARIPKLALALALLSLGMSCREARARTVAGSGLEELKVKRACLYYTYSPNTRRHWKKSGERLKVGDTLMGKIVIRKNKLVLFKRNGQIQATHFDCFEGPQDRFSLRALKTFASLGFLSWQETYSVTSPTGTTYPLLSNAAGACVGAGIELRHGRWDFGLDACLSFAKAQLSQDSSVTDGFTLDVRNANVFSIVLSPEALWRPLSENVLLGFNLPLVARFASIPVPAATADGEYKLSSPISLFPSLLFEARLERLPIAISQKIGFYRSLSRFLWLIELQYHFK